MWVIRAGRGAEHIDDFVQKNVVAFGDDRLGKLPVPVTKDQLLQIYAEKFPEEKEGTRASWASQLLRLVNEVKIGDDAACFDRDRRRYILGKVTSECEWLPNVVPNKPNVRHVEWAREVFRDALSPATKNTLGSSLTVFKLNAEAAKDMVTHAVPLGSAPPPVAPQPSTPDAERNEAALGQISADTFEKANEFIEDEIDKLDWKQMQDLVAGILRAMGYRTTVSDAGPDRGVDVFASRDGLGLEEPRIFVEVKHRTNQITSKEVRSFVGGRRKGDKCLYVSTGGFSKDAYYEAERAEVALTLVTLPRLRQLVTDFYDRLDSETRTLVPLRRLYWPAVNVGA